MTLLLLLLGVPLAAGLLLTLVPPTHWAKFWLQPFTIIRESDQIQAAD